MLTKRNKDGYCEYKHCIDGGLNVYYAETNRHNDEEPLEGRKVKYLNKNGYDHDRERANKFFKEGEILTVKEIYVDSWSSTVEFEEFPGKVFNTVMFTDLDGIKSICDECGSCNDDTDECCDCPHWEHYEKDEDYD